MQDGDVRLGAGLDVPVQDFHQLTEYGIVETGFPGGIDEISGDGIERGVFVKNGISRPGGPWPPPTARRSHPGTGH
jgi:hypothetical protein